MPHMLIDQAAQFPKIRPLALTAGNQDGGPAHAPDCGHGGAGVGGLGVVDPLYSPIPGNPLATMRQSPEVGGSLNDPGIQFYSGGMDQRHGGQHIRQVLVSPDAELIFANQPSASVHQDPGRTILDRAEVQIIAGILQSETDRIGRRPERDAQIDVVAIDDRPVRVLEYPELGPCVSPDVPVAIHVIFADVEDHRRDQIQGTHRLKLKARQLEDVVVGTFFLQQIQCGRTDIPSGEHLPAGGMQHVPDQHGHSRLAVRSGNADHRRSGFPCEQLDIPRQNTGIDGFGQLNARTQHDFVVFADSFHRNPSRYHLDIGIALLQRRQIRRYLARIGDGQSYRS